MSYQGTIETKRDVILNQSSRSTILPEELLEPLADGDMEHLASFFCILMAFRVLRNKPNISNFVITNIRVTIITIIDTTILCINGKYLQSNKR